MESALRLYGVGKNSLVSWMLMINQMPSRWENYRQESYALQRLIQLVERPTTTASR